MHVANHCLLLTLIMSMILFYSTNALLTPACDSTLLIIELNVFFVHYQLIFFAGKRKWEIYIICMVSCLKSGERYPHISRGDGNKHCKRADGYEQGHIVMLMWTGHPINCVRRYRAAILFRIHSQPWHVLGDRATVPPFRTVECCNSRSASPQPFNLSKHFWELLSLDSF